MAICPSYGSSSEVALYYAYDPDPTDPDLTNQAMTWQQIRMTGESLELALTSTQSEEITPQRSYSNSILTQGSVTGGFNFEASAGFLDNWIVSALQANKELRFIGVPKTADRWTHGEYIVNGSRKQCLALLKRVMLANGKWDWYVYRGVQVSSMSLSFEPGATVTGSVSVMGTAGQVHPSTINPNPPATWTFVPDYNNPLMSAVSSLTGLQLQNSSSVDLAIIFQNFNITLDNQLREQFGVGTGSIYAAGVASGRFMATMEASAYYSNPTIYSSLVADSELKIAFNMVDSAGEGWQWLFDKVKVTGGSTPMAGSPDSDLIISSQFQGFESSDAAKGTVRVYKVGAAS